MPEQTEIIKSKARGFVLGYRMPSEQRKPFLASKEVLELETQTEKELREKCFSAISTTRQNSQKYLQQYGILATTSLVLCSDKRTRDELNEARERAYTKYKELNKFLVSQKMPTIGEPTVKIIPLIETQFTDLAQIAKANLIDKLTAQIERYSDLLKNLDALDEKKRKLLGYRVEHEKKDLAQTETLAKEVGIDISETSTLNELMKQAIAKLKGD